MPEYIAVRCFSCKLAQCIQKPKSRKFQCRVCSSKQSVRQQYAISYSAKDIREEVMKLNMPAEMMEAEGGDDNDDVEFRCANEMTSAARRADESNSNENDDEEQQQHHTPAMPVSRWSNWNAPDEEEEESQQSNLPAILPTHPPLPQPPAAIAHFPVAAEADDDDAEFEWMKAVPNVTPVATVTPATHGEPAVNQDYSQPHPLQLQSNPNPSLQRYSLASYNHDGNNEEKVNSSRSASDRSGATSFGTKRPRSDTYAATPPRMNQYSRPSASSTPAASSSSSWPPAPPINSQQHRAQSPNSNASFSYNPHPHQPFMTNTNKENAPPNISTEQSQPKRQKLEPSTAPTMQVSQPQQHPRPPLPKSFHPSTTTRPSIPSYVPVSGMNSAAALPPLPAAPSIRLSSNSVPQYQLKTANYQDNQQNQQQLIKPLTMNQLQAPHHLPTASATSNSCLKSSRWAAFYEED